MNFNIPGAQNCSFSEDIADLFLCVANSLDRKTNVEVMESGRTFKVCYRDHGNLGQIFDQTLEWAAGLKYGLNVPFTAATTCAFAFTYLTTLPFYAIGHCMKVAVLETDPKAKEYNQMTADHLEKLQKYPLDFLENFNKSYHSYAQAKATQQLIFEKIKDKPKKPFQTKLQVLPKDGNPGYEFDLFIRIHACYDDEVSYEFKGQNDKWTSLGLLTDQIHAYEKKFAEIEKIEQLQKEFISDVTKLFTKEKQD